MRLFLKTKGALVAAALLLPFALNIAFGLSVASGLLRDDAVYTTFVGLCLFALCFGSLMCRITCKPLFKESLLYVGVFGLWWLFLFQGQDILFPHGGATAYVTVVIGLMHFLFWLCFILGACVTYLFFGSGKRVIFGGFENMLGFRYLMGKKNHHVISTISLISIFAISLGCAGMVLVMSVMNGFSEDLREKILGSNPHVLLMKYGKEFGEYGELLEKAAKVKGVISAAPYLMQEVMVSSSMNTTGGMLKGLDLSVPGRADFVAEKLTKGSLDALKTNPADSQDQEAVPGILLGKEMARNLKVFMGDIIQVTSPLSGELGPAGLMPSFASFQVRGIFESGMHEYDSQFAFGNLTAVQELFGYQGNIDGLEFRIENIEHAGSIAHKIQNLAGDYPYYTRDWIELNRPLFSALRLEKMVMFLILTSLMVMASLLILVSLILVVIEKGKEISILKSMGTADASIMRIFVTYGLSIGTVGATIGVLIGLGLSLFLAKFAIGLDPEVYFVTELPVVIKKTEIWVVWLAAIVTSFLATIPPALYGAKLKPVAGLRHD